MSQQPPQPAEFSQSSDACCCRTRAAHASTHIHGFIFRWLFPSAALVLMPKCPVCFAMYFALATGIGLSITTASALRIICLVGCTALLLYSASRPARRLLRRTFSDTRLTTH